MGDWPLLCKMPMTTNGTPLIRTVRPNGSVPRGDRDAQRRIGGVEIGLGRQPRGGKLLRPFVVAIGQDALRLRGLDASFRRHEVCASLRNRGPQQRRIDRGDRLPFLDRGFEIHRERRDSPGDLAADEDGHQR
jgi:hypothetical protein